MRRKPLRNAAWSLGAIALPLFSQDIACAAEVSLPAFYRNVTRMKPEGRLGQVIAKEQIATQIPGAVAWRIAYVSSDLQDRPTISTGLVIAPKGKPKAEGRPIIAWAHGTTGTAQNCGPSQVLDPAQPLNEYFLIGGTSWTDFGVPAAEEFIKEGYVVVATDYQGLGGGGKHQYAIAATQARDAINSVRAAGSMGLSGTGKKAALYGWSQGGGAVIAAASMPDYIQKNNTVFDGIEFTGFVALAPQDIAVTAPNAASMDEAGASKVFAELTHSFSGNVFNFTHYAMSMWALPAAFPNLKMTDIFTEEGVKATDEILSKKCMHAAADTMSFNYGETYKSLLKPQPNNVQAWIKALVQGSVPATKPVAPVAIYWGAKDTTVPPVMGQLYREQMCKLGGNITRVELPGEQSHFTTPPVAQPMYVSWIKDRFANKPPSNGCESN